MAIAGKRRKSLDEGCGVDCGHTIDEHAAFDLGLEAGENHGREAIEPDYSDEGLSEAWLTGHSVGCLNRED